jgi:hypothetical protein
LFVRLFDGGGINISGSEAGGRGGGGGQQEVLFVVHGHNPAAALILPSPSLPTWLNARRARNANQRVAATQQSLSQVFFRLHKSAFLFVSSYFLGISFTDEDCS